MEEDDFPEQHKKWLQVLSQGILGGEIEHRSLQGIKILIAQKGYIQCSFVPHKLISDHNGNWHPGAMATLIDDVGAAAVGSSVGSIRLSVNFDISFLSTVKIEEEVVIDAWIMSNKGKLSSVLVEVRKKDSGEIVARGKQWMYSAFDPHSKRSSVKVKQQDDIPLQCKKWVESISKGVAGPEVEIKCLQGLKVVRAEKGFFLCTFVVPKTLADINGNWHTGAIAVLIDDLAATVVASLGEIKLSVDFDISFLSTAKIEEEVEIEAKVLSQKGKLTSVLVEVRRKDNRKVVALAKQWMTAFNTNPPSTSKL